MRAQTTQDDPSIPEDFEQYDEIDLLFWEAFDWSRQRCTDVMASMPPCIRKIRDRPDLGYLRIAKVQREVDQALAFHLMYPSNSALSEAPWIIGRMYPLSLSFDKYDEPRDFASVVVLYWYWSVKVIDLIDKYGISNDLFKAIRRLDVDIAWLFGGPTALDRKIDLECALDNLTIIKHTRECWGPDGGLTDEGRATAAWRHFEEVKP